MLLFCLNIVCKMPFKYRVLGRKHIDMVKYSNKTLSQLEEAIKSNNFELRYEMGQFNSGFCILDKRRVIIINKFFQTESRINTLLEIIVNLKSKGDFITTPEMEEMITSINSD